MEWPAHPPLVGGGGMLILVYALCAGNPINVLFFYSFFQEEDSHMGVTLLGGQRRDNVYY